MRASQTVFTVGGPSIVQPSHVQCEILVLGSIEVTLSWAGIRAVTNLHATINVPCDSGYFGPSKSRFHGLVY